MASTYVNNLRLNEMATGDASGTWGTTTNTNLELIGEALGYGTEAITTNADTHTSTVADGASDAARAMYVKYTGTLDSACTITIAPNTMKRVQIIENATSGSQSIIIKQGSGSTVTIPTGRVAVVYLDGAGSGGAVVNAFTDLDLAGTLSIAGAVAAATDMTVGDDLTLSSDAGVLGFGADTDVTLTHVADTGLLLNSSRQLQFGDSGTYIHQSADGVLDLVADTEIEINATTIDINGAVDISGNALVSGEVQTANIGYTDGDNAITIADGGGITAANGITSTAAANTFGATSFNDADITNVGSMALDTITNDGTDITLDSSGDIILDADGSQVFFKDDGTTRYTFNLDATPDLVMAGGNASITTSTSNADFTIIGNDGGSDINALVFDMSEAGKAIFNQGLVAGTSTAGDWGLILNTASSDSVKLQVADTGTGSAANATLSVSDGDLILSPSTGLVGIGTTDPVSALSVTQTNNSAGDLWTAVGPGNVPSVMIQNAGTTDNNNAGLFFKNDNEVSAAIAARFTDHSDEATQIRFSTHNGSNIRERITIDAFGNLLLGESANVFNPGDFGSASGINVSGTQPMVLVHESDTDKDGYIGMANSTMFVHTADAIPMRFSTSDAERMRILSTGTLLVTATTSSGLSNGTSNFGHSFGGGQQVNATNNDTNLILNMSNGSSNPHIQFRSNGGNTGSISTNGSAVAYNTGSDYRLKENVIPLKDGLERVKKLNPVQFDWKKSQETDEGFIAHEAQEIVPYVVKGEKDGEEIQTMDYGKLTPLIVKAIQEQQTIIDDLKTRIEALEG